MTEKIKKDDVAGVVGLLVHAAKIDEKYTDDEKKNAKKIY